MAEQKKLRIFELDPNLNAFEGDINDRVNRYKNKKKEEISWVDDVIVSEVEDNEKEEK